MDRILKYGSRLLAREAQLSLGLVRERMHFSCHVWGGNIEFTDEPHFGRDGETLSMCKLRAQDCQSCTDKQQILFGFCIPDVAKPGVASGSPLHTKQTMPSLFLFSLAFSRFHRDANYYGVVYQRSRIIAVPNSRLFSNHIIW